MIRPRDGRANWPWYAVALASGGLASLFYFGGADGSAPWWLVAALVGGVIGSAALAAGRATAVGVRAGWPNVLLGVLLAPTIGGAVGITVGGTIWIGGGGPSEAYRIGEYAAGLAAWAVLNLLLGIFVVPLVVVPIAALGAALGGVATWTGRRWRSRLRQVRDILGDRSP
jgi:hypothetical protein